MGLFILFFGYYFILQKTLTIAEEANYKKIENLKKDQTIGFSDTEIYSYKQLGFTILSLLNTCQSHLFSLENQKPTPEEENELRVDIYNLLEMVKNFLPHIEFEFLDQIIQ